MRGCSPSIQIGQVAMNVIRNFHTASNPQRVLDKLQECRRAWTKMVEIDRSGNEEELLDSLGHFLESFRSVTQRLYGVVEKQSGRPRMKVLEADLNSHPHIGFIIDRAVLETHGDGAVIWRRFNISVSDDMQARWPARWESARGLHIERWPSRFESRFEPTVRTQAIVGKDWQFAEQPRTSLLELCRAGLDDLESIVRQNIPLN
jgi:hypothetical protein